MMDPQMVNQLIRSRRSEFIDQFEAGRRIPDDIILAVLENANHAPTHKLTEPWRFTVFTGDGLTTLAQQQASIYKQFAGSKFKQNKYEQMLVNPQRCSHVIAIGMKRNPSVPEIEEILATGCAIQNIYLSAAAYGIGGYISTGGITYLEEAKPYFNLEPEDRLIGFFNLGYIKLSSPPRHPGALKDKLQWMNSAG